MAFLALNINAEVVSKTFKELFPDVTAGDNKVVNGDVIKLDNNISIKFVSTGSSKVTYYSNATEDSRCTLRSYKGTTLSLIPSAGYIVTKVSFTSGDKNNFSSTSCTASANSTYQSGTSSATWTANTGKSLNSETLYFSAQVRIISITVTYEKPNQVETPTTTAGNEIAYGAEFTISTSTKGATLSYIIDGTEKWTPVASNTVTLNAPTEGESFTIKAYAVDPTGALTQSETLTKTVTLYAPTPAEAVFTNEAGEEVTGGDVKQGSYIKFSWESGCSAEVDINGTVTPYDAESTFGTWSVDDKYKAGDEVTISVTVTNKYNKTSTATATFTVVSPYKVVDVITVNDNPGCSAYQNFSKVVKGGAVYAGRFMDGSGAIQINGKTSGSAAGSGVFMTNSVGYVSKVSVEWGSGNTAGRTLNIYGKNEPYVAYASENEADCKTYVGAGNTAKGTLLGTIVYGTSTELTIDGDYKYIFVQVATSNAAYLNSITFEWEDAFEYGDDISYEMQRETTKLTEGKFITLVDATNGKAVSRKNAAEGTIAGSAASVEVDTENNKTSLNLKKGQFSIDEFELVPVLGGGFKLYGGGSITRRYIGYDATGLTTKADENDAAVVTLESDGKGVVVKFTDGDIIVSDGTNFGKGVASTESATSLTEGATLVPAYVFVSPGKDSTGVEDIEMVETEAPAQYYNLNGVEVKAGNLVPGIYIVRQGNKVSKQFIR